MDNRFDRDTALKRTDQDLFEGRIDGGWWIVRGPNGGYIASIVLRAMTMTVADPTRHPRSMTVHYVRPPVEGPVTVRTVAERTGRTLSTVSARMEQDGKLVALALGAFSGPFGGSVEFSEIEMPDAPPPESLPLRPEREGDLPFLDRFDFRWAVGVAPLGEGGEAVSGAWIRPSEPRVADALLVAQLMDAWAPAVFSKVMPPAGVPTIDLTIHFRRSLPVPGATPDDYLLGVFRTRTAHDGFIEEDGELWTRDGLLLAQSRQLAILIPGRA
ncbi:MAG TPA: thioesterase family protein [Actinomycetota bacterium]|nr:thioesterase family protein [Actinomycetota bacterium]